MQTYTFTPSSTGADPGATAAYQARLAKLKPACVRCGHNLSKSELAEGRTCRDREVCGIRRSGGSPAGYVALRKRAREIAARRAGTAPEPVGAPVAPSAPVAAPEPAQAPSTLVGAYARMFAAEPAAPRARRWPIV